MEKKQEYWEGLAAGFFFLAAMGAMMFLVLAVLDLAGTDIAAHINGPASLAAALIAGLGSLLLMVELGNKTKFYLVMSKPSSIMSLGAITQGVFIACAFIYATFFFDFIPWAGFDVLQKTFAILGIITAIILTAYPGLELGEARGRGFWSGSGLVPLFLITGTVTGLTGVLLAACTMGFADNRAVIIMDMVLLGFLILQVILIAGYILWARRTGAEEARRSVDNILYGDFRMSFWGGTILAGTVMPLLAYLAGNIYPVLIVKWALILIGNLCFRITFLQAAVRKTIPGEEKEWTTEKEAARIGMSLEKKWQEKAVWLYPDR